MKRFVAWARKSWLILPVLVLVVGISLCSQSCPPRFKTSAATFGYYYLDSDDDDAYIYKQDGSSWNNAHDATSGTMDASNALIQIGVSNNYDSSGVWRAWRGFHVFDTSGLPDDALITAAYMKVYVDEVGETTPVRNKMYVVGGNASYPSEPIAAGDFDIAHYTLSPYAGSSDFIDSLTVDAWNTITLSSTGIADISKTGNTRFVTMLTYDVLDNEPPDGDRAYVDYASADSASDPYLEIWYETSPTVTSQAASSVSFTTATTNGNVTDTGYHGHVDYRGCVYGTTSHGDPGNVAPWSAGYDGYMIEGPSTYPTGAYTSDLNSLSQDQVYYYRMFCTTDWGVDYSATEQSFHTLQLCSITTSAATLIMNTTARLPGNVTDAGYPTTVTVTVYWGDNDGGNTPTWDYSAAPDSYPGGVAAFYKDITGLTPGGTYYFNAKGNNTSGDVYAGSRSFVAQNTPPTVTTNAATSVANTSATLNGNIDSCGGDPTCSNYGFVWATSTHGDPGNTDPSASAYSDYWKAGSSHGTGAISHAVTLLARTTYYFRACAYNNAGWDYGTELSFTTCDKPDVTTVAVTAPTLVGGIFHGTIDNVWGANCNYYGWVLATVTHGDPGNVAPASSGYSDYWQSGSGTYTAGSYTHTYTTLTPGTKYYYRFFAHNTYGWTYGTELHFGTIPEDPTNLAVGAMTYTSINLSWTKGAHAAQTMIRYETESTTGTYPAGPSDGTEAYFNTGTSCVLDLLNPGETYYIAGWSWIEGSDVWSNGYVSVVVTLSVPPPVSLKAVPIDSQTINLWWIVPTGMRDVPTVSTIIYGCVGTYPADPPDPPNASDFEVYDNVTGAEGVKDYTWTGASAGTPYFFSVWFYDNFTDNYTAAVSALCTTPAGYTDAGVPGGSGDFDPPDSSGMSDVPLNDTMEAIADTLGMQHGFFWGLFVIGIAILATMGGVIYTKSGLVATGVGGLILSVGVSQGIVNGWVVVAFVFLGLVLSWVASHVYA